ncbi:MAG TPA: hypothetical protein DCE42_00045 [Myxococcales bacterium]|nr:hypothetical protein [Deltaproteobacteria bacterium]MBU49131.1 hypothetical protein [Deltaproteobacteria bacterium]HAA53112.1 hypothetical protein [Myxococcales bacterium]|tara:strand:- start:11734 stop:12204 length:471 start_codon:yes stop_codon:yes gene_type:complete
MNATVITWLIFLGIIVLILLVNVRAFFHWLGGSWYEKKDADSPRQEIKLMQLGPIVWGHAKVKGGTLNYRGWFNGKVLKMKRRDYGQAYLAGLGFPQEVLMELEGSEMARLEFEYDPVKRQLVGAHYPQKIDISHTRPPKVIGRVYLSPQKRTWKR